ncbi:hypothetical protein VPH35_001308 [Triticum aestivum]
MECARREDGRRGEARSRLSSCARASRLLAPLRRPHSPHAIAGDHKQRPSHLSARHPEAPATLRRCPSQPRPLLSTSPLRANKRCRQRRPRPPCLI